MDVASRFSSTVSDGILLFACQVLTKFKLYESRRRNPSYSASALVKPSGVASLALMKNLFFM